jgi:hypothetical protein
MARPFSLRTYLRLVGAAGVVTFAFTLGSFVQFLNADPVSGAVLKTGTPGLSVNHFRKGDRLPLYSPAASDPGAAARQDTPRMRYHLETTDKMPVGCDPAFSPITTASPVVVYGRCTV